LESRIPLESERGYHAMALGVDIGLRMQTIWAERKFVATPMDMGLRFAGTVEFAGLSAPPDMRRADVLLRRGQRMFPSLRVGEVSRWMGHRPGLPDTFRSSAARRAMAMSFAHSATAIWGSSAVR
jgi:D-amino-acid dehydrogenase